MTNALWSNLSVAYAKIKQGHIAEYWQTLGLDLQNWDYQTMAWEGRD